MHEKDENLLRVLLTQVRQEKSEAFIDLVIDVMVARLGDDTITTLLRSDEDDIPEVAVVVVKGVKPVTHLLKAIKEMQGE